MGDEIPTGQPAMNQPPPIMPPQIVPLPVQALAYDTPYDRPRRPGLITSIGVISIVVASLSGLTSLGTGFYGIVMGIVANSMRTIMAASSTPVITSTSSVTSSGVTTWSTSVVPGTNSPALAPNALLPGPRGYGESERKVIVDALKRRNPLTAKREKLLQLLLAQSGEDMIGLDGGAITEDTIYKNVSNTGDKLGLKREPVGTFYVIGNGEIGVYDDHATFLPSDQTREPIRVDLADELSVPTASGLTAKEIDDFVDSAQSLGANGLTGIQIAGLRKALATQGQQFTKPQLGPAASQLMRVTIDARGNATIQTRTFTAFLTTTGITNGVLLQTPVRMPGMPAIPTAAIVFYVLESALSLLLAIYLLVIGILVLRQHPRGRRLHFIYAFLKLPLVFLAAYAAMTFWSSFFNSMVAPGTGAIGVGNTVGLGYAMFSMIGLIYPIALWFTLRSKTVREYYGSF